MRKLTKKETLEECQKMWQWLADNPGSPKAAYFNYKDTYPRYYCYACEHTIDEFGARNCNKCLLLELWMPGFSAQIIADRILQGNCPCEASTSPYQSWRELVFTNRDEASRYAQRIANYCTFLLRKEKE